MKSFRQILFNGLVALSALLCAASLILWPISHYREGTLFWHWKAARYPERVLLTFTQVDFWSFEWSYGNAFLGRQFHVFVPRWSSNNEPEIWREHGNSEPPHRTHGYDNSVNGTDKWWRASFKWWRRAGFAVDTGPFPSEPAWVWYTYNFPGEFGGERGLSFPLWFSAAVFGVLPVVLLLRRLRRHLRMRSDHCPTCGYDLRATPNRCPECGHVAPAGATA